jgi:hypothetical protein
VLDAYNSSHYLEFLITVKIRLFLHIHTPQLRENWFVVIVAHSFCFSKNCYKIYHSIIYRLKGQ